MKFTLRMTGFNLNRETVSVIGLKLEAGRTILKSFEVFIILSIKYKNQK